MKVPLQFGVLYTHFPHFHPPHSCQCGKDTPYESLDTSLGAADSINQMDTSSFPYWNHVSIVADSISCPLAPPGHYVLCVPCD